MRKRKVRPLVVILISLIVAGGVIRFFYLPQLISRHIDRQLEMLHESITYRDYSISVLTTSVSLKDVSILPESNDGPYPFFEADRLTAKLDWKALTQGFWVSKISIDEPRINFLKTPDVDSTRRYVASDLTGVIQRMVVLPVNEIEINNGEILYHDLHSIPKVILKMTDITLMVSNLQNANGDEKVLPGTATGSARVGNAMVNIDVQMNPFFAEPTFELNAELTDLNLVDVRDFLRAYGQVDVQQGLFSLYTQAGSRNNRVVGFVKPMVRDVTIASLRQGETSGNHHLVRPSMRRTNGDVWLVTSLANNLEEIRFEATLPAGRANIWNAVGATLHNAFIEALVAMLEDSVKRDKQTSPTPAKQDIKASRVSAEDKKKKGLIRRIFKRNENRKSKTRDK